MRCGLGRHWEGDGLVAHSRKLAVHIRFWRERSLVTQRDKFPECFQSRDLESSEQEI